MPKPIHKNEHKNLHILQHPLLSHSLSILRKKETSCSEFRRLLSEVSRLMAYESSRDLTVKDMTIETPFEQTDSPFICEDVTVVAVMRAGMGMLDGFMQMFPLSKIGHIGIYRDKFLNNTVEYYFRLPDDIEGNKIFLLDPLLATGSTVVAAINRLKQYGVKEVRFNCLLASPEGLEILHDTHPDVSVYCLAMERGMNEKGYLLPGIGDAGIAFMELYKELGAKTLEENKNIKIIAISGGSGSGKTTAAHKLQKMLGPENCKILSQDSYYHDHSAQFKGDGSVNFDHPDAIDFNLMANHLEALSQNKPVEIPIYDFVTHTRKKECIYFEPTKVIIVDGILVLSQKILRHFFNISIFIDIPEDIRFSRRLKRDVEERGRQPEGVKLQFFSFVKPMHETFVQPSRVFATHIVTDDVSLNQLLHELKLNIL